MATQPDTKPEMTRLQSSNLFSVGHRGNCLYVTFKTGEQEGATWRYGNATKPCPAKEKDEVLKGGGSYFHRNIKLVYPAERMP